jgi:hypothetical protein
MICEICLKNDVEEGSNLCKSCAPEMYEMWRKSSCKWKKVLSKLFI